MRSKMLEQCESEFPQLEATRASIALAVAVGSAVPREFSPLGQLKRSKIAFVEAIGSAVPREFSPRGS
jgi:hypothetical protein